ncbi:hypothetical protein DPMN_084634 [Dreissena polymorpha]|uniref:Uncharacterized protein n=1 Tax=Dreissena polymorpha TaxID=45954 RepID=A0A9D4BC66_DREPO|nr:hypothetical protein DPMN_084634 [Dreissena polymorpha]
MGVANINGKNLLTKFQEDRKINVASRVLKRNKMFGANRQTGQKQYVPNYYTSKTIFELIQDIIGTNLLTKFHDDLLSPRPCGGHVFQPTGIIFKLVQDIIGMNLLTEFHEDRTINVASRVKNAPPLGGHVIQANVTIFELIQDIINPLHAGKFTNLLTIFHQDWTINVASKVLTRKNAPPPGGHVFQPTGIIFKLVQDIIGMNLLTKKNAHPVTIFELIKDISGTNLLTKFHKDRKINVASRVFTRKNAPPPGGHEKCPAPWPPCFSSKHIIETNLLIKFCEDWTINVASRE